MDALLNASAASENFPPHRLIISPCGTPTKNIGPACDQF